VDKPARRIDYCCVQIEDVAGDASTSQSMIETSTILDLIAEGQEACLFPEAWPNVLERLGAQLRGSVVRLGFLDLKAGQGIEFSTALDVAVEKVFQERYLTPETNPGLRFMLSVPAMTIAPREVIQTDKEMLRSDFYNEVMRPNQGWHAATGAPHRSDEHMVTFGAIRSRSAGAYDETELTFLRLVLPHLQRSIRVFRHLAELEARASAAEAALARFSSAVVVTDAAGRIGSINEQARALLAEADGLLIRDGRITATKREDAARLERLIQDAGGGPGPHRCRRSGLMCVTRKPRRRQLQLAITPLHGQSALSHMLSVSIVFSEPNFGPEPRVEVLARLFSLTPREAAVAGLLLEGHSPTAAAEIMSIRITTMRTHIQHLFHKTQTTRLPELIALLYRNVL